MKASVMDLRYKTRDILHALEVREEIILTHRGSVKGRIVPAGTDLQGTVDILGHPAVGMWKDEEEPVSDTIRRIRKPRSC